MNDEEYWELRAILVLLSSRMDHLESCICHTKETMANGFRDIFQKNFDESRQPIKDALLKMYPDILEMK